MKLPIILLAALALAGCKSVPKKYTAPESAPLVAAQDKAAQHVAKAHAATVRAKVSVAKAKHFHKAEGDEIKAIQVAIDAPEFQNAPPDLLPLIEGLRGQIALHDATHAQTATEIEITNAAVNEAEFESGKAGEVQAIIQAKLGPDYVAAAEALASAASMESDARAKAENRVRELERKNWLRRALEAVAGVAIIAGLFLWFTGKLSLAGLRAAR